MTSAADAASKSYEALLTYAVSTDSSEDGLTSGRYSWQRWERPGSPAAGALVLLTDRTGLPEQEQHVLGIYEWHHGELVLQHAALRLPIEKARVLVISPASPKPINWSTHVLEHEQDDLFLLV